MFRDYKICIHIYPEAKKIEICKHILQLSIWHLSAKVLAILSQQEWNQISKLLI